MKKEKVTKEVLRELKKLRKKRIKGYAVWCNEQGVLTAHWDFAGAVRQMKEINVGSYESGLRCSHKVVSCEIILK